MSEKEYTSVSDVMSKGVHTVSGMATVAEAINIMQEHNVSSLVVERRGEHDEYGLVEVYDVAKDVISDNKSADRVNVYEIMQKPVMSVPADMDIRYAIRHLVRFKLSRALVIDDKRAPVGLVTIRDMVLKHMEG